MYQLFMYGKGTMFSCVFNSGGMGGGGGDGDGDGDRGWGMGARKSDV